MVRKRQGKRVENVDICNVEEGTEKGGVSTIKVDFQVAAVKKPLISVKSLAPLSTQRWTVVPLRV